MAWPTHKGWRLRARDHIRKQIAGKNDTDDRQLRVQAQLAF